MAEKPTSPKWSRPDRQLKSMSCSAFGTSNESSAETKSRKPAASSSCGTATQPAADKYEQPLSAGSFHRARSASVAPASIS
eukprot:scaffold805_cov110-Isochrysis_galbana.AAC.8